jgi:putative hydrolase of the HAD superfamily
MTGGIRAVTFDLDDTLYPQAAYLAGAWRSVAAALAVTGMGDLVAARLHRALVAIAAEGSDRGRIIDRALAACGLSASWAPRLVAAFRDHEPASLDLYPGAREAIARLRRRVPIGLVTDGDPAIQRAKLRALGLTDAFDVVVLSDELGRAHRKPDPLPFERALSAFAIPAAAAVHVGDRPAKDVAGATRVGMRAIRVRTGEYRGQPDDPAVAAWLVCDSVAGAVAAIEGELSARPARAPRPAPPAARRSGGSRPPVAPRTPAATRRAGTSPTP